MKKSILCLIGFLFVTSFAIVSCGETDGVEDPYANWEERNQQYLDSIAAVANAHLGDKPGEWKKIHSYKFPEPPLLGGEVSDYVYCKIITVGDGDVSPMFNDTASIHYRGKLMNGTIFDQTYNGAFDPETAVPVASGNVGGFVTGFTTALQKMKVGDRWEVYIPYQLAYGESDYMEIPGHSVLNFDLSLADILPLKGTSKSVAEEEEE